MSIRSPEIDGKVIVAVGVLVLLVVAGVAGTTAASGQAVGISVDQTPGERLTMTIVDSGSLDSLQFVAPSGTRSTQLSWEISAGSRITVRSNETVYEFFEDNNITIPTTTQEDGFMRITSPDDVPSQDLALQDDEVTQDTAYNRRSAYLACLYENAFISVPCHSPVLVWVDIFEGGTWKLGSNDIVDELRIEDGTAREPLTTPLILEKGEYKFLGATGGNCRVIRTVSVESGELPGHERGDKIESELCDTETQSETGGEGLPGFTFSAAFLALAVGVAAIAYRRFR